MLLILFFCILSGINGFPKSQSGLFYNLLQGEPFTVVPEIENLTTTVSTVTHKYEPTVKYEPSVKYEYSSTWLNLYIVFL